MPEVMINGPEGRIEARYHCTNHKNAPVALILHPNPQRGGNMNNKVAFTLYKTFSDLGFNVLRFNFRGVGRSEGSYSQGEGELGDAASCLDWLQTQNPEPFHCWVAGFSFGAWIGMQLLMRRPEFNGFISISPPANLYDFSFLAPCPTSGLVIQGDLDTIVPKDAALRLANRLSSQRGINVDFQLIKGADHFFKNNLNDISRYVAEYVQKAMAPPKQSVRKAAAAG
jgi:uncharacterized protein